MRRGMVGLEIGTHNIKIIEAKKKGMKWEVIHTARIETPKESVVNGELISQEEVVCAIKEVIQKKKIKEKKVYLLIDSSDVIAREIEVNGSNHKYLKELLNYRIEEYLPIDARNYEVDFEVIEEIEKEGRKVVKLLAVAAPKALVKQYIELSELLELKLKGISIQAANLGKAFRMISREETEEELTTLMIDIGGQATDLTIVKGQNTRLTQKIEFGSHEINKKIMEIFDEDDLEEVEYFKQRYAAIYEEEHLLDEDFYGNYISQIIKADMNHKLIEGIQKFIRFYHMNSHEKIDKVYLIGGGSGIKHIDSYIERATQIEVEILKQTEYFINSEEFEDEIPYFANLLGLVRGA
ncbi:MAG: type IV pilus assembly protein PilM [Cellulosilyticaceae bacterium]